MSYINITSWDNPETPVFTQEKYNYNWKAKKYQKYAIVRTNWNETNPIISGITFIMPPEGPISDQLIYNVINPIAENGVYIYSDYKCTVQFRLYEYDNFNIDNLRGTNTTGVIAMAKPTIKMKYTQANKPVVLDPLSVKINIKGKNLVPGKKYVLIAYHNYKDSIADSAYEIDLDFSNAGPSESTWNLKLYCAGSVTYDANGGNTINESHGFDTSFTVTDTIPTKNGTSSQSNFKITGLGGDSNTESECTKTDTVSYRFLGWNTDKSATTALYTAGQVVSDLVGEVTLYAIWEQYISNTSYSNNLLSSLPVPSKSNISETYTVTLNANGGTILNNKLTCPVTIKYAFKEWVDAENQPIDKNTQFYEDTTVYATWEEYVSGSVELPISKKQGNIFLGWKESEEATDFVPNIYVPKEDCTLYAIYKVGYLIEAYIRLSNKWVKINMD